GFWREKHFRLRYLGGYGSCGASWSWQAAQAPPNRPHTASLGCFLPGLRFKFFPVIRLVLFDIDGTLIQTGGAGVQAFGRAFATEFNTPNGTERLKFSGRTDTGLARELFRQHQIEPTAENLRLFF